MEDRPLKKVTINDLRALINEELEVVLTNEEVKEFFDVDIKEELNEIGSTRDSSIILKKKEIFRNLLKNAEGVDLSPEEEETVLNQFMALMSPPVK